MTEKRTIMPVTAAVKNLTLVEEALDLGNGVTIRFKRPEEPAALLDLEEVHAAYARDEYMPYWATLWPVSKYLACRVAAEKWAAGARAIELGCGLGLPGLAALASGLDVTFSDYDDTALAFAADNARLNGFSRFHTLALDWRDPPAVTYDVILASDVLYEARNVEPVVEILDRLLTRDGIALFADQNRPYQDEFKAALKKRYFSWEATALELREKIGDGVDGTIFTVKRF